MKALIDLNMSVTGSLLCSTAVYLMHGLQVTAVLARQVLLGQLQLELSLSVSLPGAASQSGNLQIKLFNYQDIKLLHTATLWAYCIASSKWDIGGFNGQGS